MMKRRPRIKVPTIPPYVFWPAGQIFVWGALLGKRSHGTVGPAAGLVYALILVVSVVQIIRTVRNRAPIRWSVAWLLNTVSIFIGQYSWIYWQDGNTANFSQKLSRLDAVYFTVGTFSTAGTGNVAAVSESARSIQLSQMLIGMAIALVGVGAVVSALATPKPPLIPKRTRTGARKLKKRKLRPAN